MTKYIINQILEDCSDRDLANLLSELDEYVDAYPIEELEDHFKNMEPYRAFCMGVNSSISYMDDYFIYDGYANIQTITEYRYNEMVKDKVIEVLEDMDIDDLENYRNIDAIDDYLTKLEEINEQIDKDEYIEHRKQVMEIINEQEKPFNERIQKANELEEEWWSNATDEEKMGAYFEELFNHEFMYDWDIEFSIRQCLPLSKEEDRELFKKAYDLANRYVNLTMEV